MQGSPRKGTRDTNLRERTAREINKLGHAVAAARPFSPVLTYFGRLLLSRTPEALLLMRRCNRVIRARRHCKYSLTNAIADLTLLRKIG